MEIQTISIFFHANNSMLQDSPMSMCTCLARKNMKHKGLRHNVSTSVLRILDHMSDPPWALSPNIVPFFNHSGSLLGWLYERSVVLFKIDKCVYWLTFVGLQDLTSIRIRPLVYSIVSFLLTTTKPLALCWEHT